jgi:chemotaxis protein MotB
VSAGAEETKAHELVIIRHPATGEEGAHKGGVWKIAYADFMTAMMAFFLVLWLVNSTDDKILTQVATYFNPVRLTDKTPQPKGVHQAAPNAQAPDRIKEHEPPEQPEAHTTGKPERPKPKLTEKTLYRDPQAALAKIAAYLQETRPLSDAPAQPASDAQSSGGQAYRDPFDLDGRRERELAKPHKTKQEERARTPGSPGPAHAERESAPVPNASRDGRLPDRELAAELEKEIKRAIAQVVPGSMPNIEVVATPEGVLISITEDNDFGMFAIASAEPLPAMVVIMERLGKLLAGRPESLIVRGHTDGRPYRTGSYDNWRLSAARAHMAYHMLVRGGIDEKRFERIEGHADRKLKVRDDPEAARNRRIEILLRRAEP